MLLLAREPETPWETKGFTDLVPPATLTEARAHRDDLTRLLRREREAAADFLLALADFDRRRGWERLGHAGLFPFLTRELGLSNGAAQLRLSAARLLPRHPAVEAALRSGRLCLSAVGQLARVLTPENEAEVVPRFFGRSAREAQEVAAAILPCPNPPRREVVTRVTSVVRDVVPVERLATAAALPTTTAVSLHTSEVEMAPSTGHVPLHTSEVASPTSAAGASLHTSEVTPTRPAWGRCPEVEPLSAEFRRFHLTVPTRFLEKVAAARVGLSHARPGATTEQVLEAALDLLLEKQARAKALVKRPRAAAAHSKAGTNGAPPAPMSSRTIPAAIEREVRLRDGNSCQLPLDAGGVCGSTWQVELDHVVPLALGGPTTVANLRCACRTHNRRAAEVTLGAAVVANRPRRRR